LTLSSNLIKYPEIHQEETLMKIKPIHDRLLVKRLESDERSAGGIIIPDHAREKPAEGEVISVGSGTVNKKGKVQKITLKEGDRILFGKWSGSEIKIDGEDYLFLREDDVLGIVE
jgi:chaperonin GroES